MNDREDSNHNPPAPEPQTNGRGAPYTGHPDDLHNLIAVAGSDEEDPLAALRNDPNYSELIRELEYIAQQARLLFQPSEEAPSDEVWQRIQSQLPTKPDA